jgi:hypothetical protein
MALIKLDFDRISVWVEQDEFEQMVQRATELGPTELQTSSVLSKELRAEGRYEEPQLLAILARHEAMKRTG